MNSEKLKITLELTTNQWRPSLKFVIYLTEKKTLTRGERSKLNLNCDNFYEYLQVKLTEFWQFVTQLVLSNKSEHAYCQFPYSMGLLNRLQERENNNF